LRRGKAAGRALIGRSATVGRPPGDSCEAGVIDGRDVTSYPSIATDVKNAGGRWQDAAVVTDQALITSRNPDDLDAFCNRINGEIEEGRHERSAA